MKNSWPVFWVLFALVLPCSASGQSAQNLKSFDMVWQTVNDTHFDPTFGGVNWEKMRSRYRPRITSSSNLAGFQLIANQMLFELRLSHLLVASERMLKTYMPTLFSKGAVGIETRWIQNRAVVFRINPGLPGLAEGVKAGYVITRIDGRDVEEIVLGANHLPPFNDRNHRGGIANYLAGVIDGPPGTAVTLTYEDGQDRSKEVVLTRQSRGAGKTISDAMPPVFVEFQSRRLESNIGYFRFNHFVDPVAKAFLTALAKFHDTHGLIIDLRGNPGGYFNAVDTIIENLVSERVLLYRFQFRDKIIDRIITPSESPYTKPVAILIDETSMSSSELFAACLQALGRAVIIGSHSPGYLLGAQWKKLPNGLSFMHTFLEPIPFDGRIVEGNGVKPDIPVHLDRNSLLSGKDNQLEAAISYIQR